MCFSPEADIVAGIVVSGVGVDALRQVKETRQYPLASLPLLLGVHLLAEVYVWWGETGRVAEYVSQTATWAYLAFALGVLPVLVPVAILAIEPDGRRRRWLMPFVGLGAGVAALYLAGVITGPVSAGINGCCLSYNGGPGHTPLLGVLYVVVTCFPSLFSSHRPIVAFGVINLVAVPLIGWLLASGFASVWCAWAAITSVLVNIHLRRSSLRGTRNPLTGSGRVVA
jgi:hypothetical protein